jgi:hypothetical protein
MGLNSQVSVSRKLIKGFSEVGYNKKFWEEVIRLLSLLSYLFEAIEPSLMGINLSELTLNLFNSI